MTFRWRFEAVSEQADPVSAGPGVSDALAAGGMMPAGVWL